MAEWQSAPLVVPKFISKAGMCLAVYLRLANAATIKEAWTMSHLDAEVNDFATSQCFVCLDVFSSYWQLLGVPYLVQCLWNCDTKRSCCIYARLTWTGEGNSPLSTPH